MTRRILIKCTTNHELEQHFDHHPALITWRKCGGHKIYTGPTGQVVITTHPGECPRGTLKSILKMAVLAGLAVAVLVVLL